MDKDDFKKEVEKLLPKGLQEESGRILYSDSGTLKKGAIYLLGFNPGGTPDNTKPKEWIINNVCYNNGEHAYIDQCWSNYSKGKHPLQNKVCWLLNELVGNKEKFNENGIDEESIRKICASNLIFNRSPNANADPLGDDITTKYKLADRCWRVHKFILNIVEPELIIAVGYGGDAPTYPYLLAQLGGKEEDNNILPSAEKYKLKGFRCRINGKKCYVAGFPHLSQPYYNPESVKAPSAHPIKAWLLPKLH